MSHYINKWISGRLIGEHRMVMESHLGRKLGRHEHVHHKNGNGRDNRLENLEVISESDHVKLHHQKYPETKNCIICGQEFRPHKTKRKRQKSCGRKRCKQWAMGIGRRRITPELFALMNKEISDGNGVIATAKKFKITNGRLYQLRKHGSLTIPPLKK